MVKIILFFTFKSDGSKNNVTYSLKYLPALCPPPYLTPLSKLKVYFLFLNHINNLSLCLSAFNLLHMPNAFFIEINEISVCGSPGVS